MYSFPILQFITYLLPITYYLLLITYYLSLITTSHKRYEKILPRLSGHKGMFRH